MVVQTIEGRWRELAVKIVADLVVYYRPDADAFVWIEGGKWLVASLTGEVALGVGFGIHEVDRILTESVRPRLPWSEGANW